MFSGIIYISVQFLKSVNPEKNIKTKQTRRKEHMYRQVNNIPPPFPSEHKGDKNILSINKNSSAIVFVINQYQIMHAHKITQESTLACIGYP